MHVVCECFFVFNDTATTEIYTLSLHDALPILSTVTRGHRWTGRCGAGKVGSPCLMASVFSVKHLTGNEGEWRVVRSEEHTSELQSRQYLVCRLLLEKKKEKRTTDCSTTNTPLE